MFKLHRPGGFSIVEMMVAMSLLGLLLAGLYAIVSLGFRHAREAEVFDTVHREALLGMQKITDELTLSSKGSVGVLAVGGQNSIIYALPQDLMAVAGHQRYSYDSNGNLEWRKWCTFFHEPSTQRVFRSELALPGGAQSSPPHPDDHPLLSDFQALPPSEIRPVIRNCSLLEFREGATTPETIRVTLQVERKVTTDKTTLIRLETEVNPRNKG